MLIHAARGTAGSAADIDLSGGKEYIGNCVRDGLFFVEGCLRRRAYSFEQGGAMSQYRQAPHQWLPPSGCLLHEALFSFFKNREGIASMCRSDERVSAPANGTNGDGVQKIFVPSFYIEHDPVGAAAMSEVENLIEKEMLVECDGKRIYAYRGRALGFVCADPSLEEYKMNLLNRGGNLSIWAKPAYGLRFDPRGAFGGDADKEVGEVKRFLDVAGSHFGLQAAVFGSHGPCGAIRGTRLEDICRTVASGAQYLEEKTGLKTIPTIFINAEINVSPRLPLQHILLWMYIKREAML